MTDTLDRAPAAPPPVRSPSRAAFRAELRRGIAPWTAPAVALTIAVPMISKAPQWQGGWGDTQELLHSCATLLAGPLVAAAGCWQGGREHRRGTAALWLSVPRGRPAQLVMAALPVAVWAVVGHLLAVVGVLAATWPYAGAGGPSVGVAAVDAWFLAGAAFAGFVVGRVWRWRLTAPVLAAATYLALGIPSYSGSGLRFLNPAEQYYLEGRVPVAWFVPVMAVWAGAPVLALVIGYAARRRLLALVPLAAAALVAPLIVSAGDDLFREDLVAERLICTEAVPRVCVSGLDGPLLSQVSDALDGLHARLDGVPGAPQRYVHVFEGEPAPAGTSLLPHHARGWTVVRGRLADPPRYAHETARRLADRDCPMSVMVAESSATLRMWDTDEAVAHWLAPSGGPQLFTDPGGAYLKRLTAMGEAERRVWLGRYLATRTSCDPKAVPTL
ncbi:hypothetical protein YW5DRAFT_04152 [Streptomyces sp. Ncost-T6T-1]|uniref:hypothetical protein n=1 Tax=Streptomyces sp. Ncost-T6T-1 TaxID=1100828 RepID=UPI000804CE63|nr:hypothetical protein [Streptomyces sp. Ncost-T6T-1]SBU92913.1 hypothetical protein YW5DRAFT_04152 [Streptomyces sp. Ncost-T6T-1]